LGFYTDQIRSKVEDIRNLPTIPKVGMRIIELASDPDVSIEQLSDAIQQDPSLAARVLKIANSPFYGTVEQVDSLKLALVILGLNEVRNIALGIIFFDVMKNVSPEISRYRESFWYHSAACGVVARILGRKLDFQCEGTDFIAGLLHDMGKIVIDACFSGKFVNIFNKTFTHSPAMIEAEREILGETHEKFGGWLAEKWRIPTTICDSIAYHHEFPAIPTYVELREPRLVAISYISEAFCQQYELGWDGDSGVSDLKNERVWDVLLNGQKLYTQKDIDAIIVETLQVFHDVKPHLLWKWNGGDAS
jgi:HD-like signal output (HDOD) protein